MKTHDFDASSVEKMDLMEFNIHASLL